jgi:hypothetical protein
LGRITSLKYRRTAVGRTMDADRELVDVFFGHLQ